MTTITVPRAVLEQVLEALERYQVKRQDFDRFADEITALRAALAQPAQQEPVAWADMEVRGEDKGLSWTPGYFHTQPLYTETPSELRRQAEEIERLKAEKAELLEALKHLEHNARKSGAEMGLALDVARAALKEKNA